MEKNSCSEVNIGNIISKLSSYKKRTGVAVAGGKFAIVKVLYPSIKKLIGKGYTITEISQIVAECGLDIKCELLRSYISKIRKNRKVVSNAIVKQSAPKVSLVPQSLPAHVSQKQESNRPERKSIGDMHKKLLRDQG